MSIEVSSVSFTYARKTPFAKPGLTDVNLNVRRGEWVVIMGPTGSGKSTLLQHLNGLLKPDSGVVMVDGINIQSSRASLKAARQKVGLVFQYPEHQLFGGTVFEEVAYGPDNFGCSPAETEARVKSALDKVGLDFARYGRRHPFELSGGEKRRVALAGVLAGGPKVIALDEPTAGMDRDGREKLTAVMHELNRDHDVTLIWVTHEVSEIAALADRIVVLDKGRIVLEGAPRDVLQNPLVPELGLDVPFPAAVAGEMGRRGKPLPGPPLTMAELTREILKKVR